jgi:hypothetical protein
MSSRRSSLRRTRNALVSLAVAGSGLAAFAASEGVAHAAPAGYVSVIHCTTVSGNATYTPGLLKATARATTAVAVAQISGCSGELGAPGTGSLVATMSGKVKLGAQNFTSGTFTINWPGGALNPSNGTLSVHETAGMDYVTGRITSGALAGNPISWAYVTTANTGAGVKGNPVKAQQFIASQPLTVSENLG